VILREYLYVDTDKVRSMQAQLDGGIAEAENSTTRSDKNTGVGVKGIVNHYQQWGGEQTIQKSLGDALFPLLEDGLESAGVLRDVSEELSDPKFWISDRIQKELPPGSLIRLTSLGSLFDARYIASIFAGFASTYMGLRQLGAVPGQVPGQPRKPAPPVKAARAADIVRELEDKIPDFGKMQGDGSEIISTDALRAMVRVSRGLFTPGLHLNLTPTEDDKLTVSARLQEGRQFLDTDTEILFARYGTQRQEWTAVGTVGHYGAKDAEGFSTDTQLVSGPSVNRGVTAQYINSLMAFIGRFGFADLPQYPGFSIVPLGVYRLISPSFETDPRG
jgi:hypothetical protein